MIEADGGNGELQTKIAPREQEKLETIAKEFVINWKN